MYCTLSGRIVTRTGQPGPNWTKAEQLTATGTKAYTLRPKITGADGEGYNNGTVDPSYCGICDPMQYSASIMTNPALRKNVQHGLADFDAQAASGTLPAVTFLKPGDDDGRPGYSTLAAFENFTAGPSPPFREREAVAVHRDLRHLR